MKIILDLNNSDFPIFLGWLARKKGFNTDGIIEVVNKIHHSYYQELYDEFNSLDVDDIF